MTGQRREFARQLDAIDIKVIELFATVCEDLPGVTEALLSGRNEVAGRLAERDRAIDALYREIEQLVCREILLQAPVASDLRFLVTVLRIAPELERSHDLECQIASGAGHLLAAELSPRCRGLIERMGELAIGMWTGRRTAGMSGTARPPPSWPRLMTRCTRCTPASWVNSPRAGWLPR